MIDQTVSHYRILKEIGRGGMGVVCKAEDTRLGRPVALKFLPDDYACDPQALDRFQREARAASALNHSHICTVFDVGEHNGRHFIVMEWLEGQTIRERIQSGPVPVEELLNVGMQIVDALKIAHEKGIIHRDIKPANIFLTDRGETQVLDFGLAKQLHSVSGEAVTEAVTEIGSTLGTLPYMAPEQVRAESVDERTDIYAVGTLLYEMATGQRPFREVVSTRLVDEVLHKSPLPPRSLNAQLPADVEEVILKCMEKDRANRFQSAEELLTGLRRLVPGSSTDHPRFSPAPGRRPHYWLLSGLAFILLAALFAALDVGGIQGWLAHSFAPAPDAVPIRALAVLPLANVSGDPEDEFFADGMTDALITELGQIAALRVSSRSSIMRYKNEHKSLREIAHELDVAALVEGSVIRDGDTVRVTARLVRASPERLLWSEKYDRQLSDVLTLQSELAEAIAEEIHIVVTPREKQALGRSRPVDPEAYLLYLRGRFQWNRRTKDGFDQALKYFEEALTKDRDFALAHAGIAYTYNLFGHELYAILNPNIAYPKAKKAAELALEQDPTLAEAHSVLADVLMRFDREWEETGKRYKQAIDANPSYSTAHQWYSHYLLPMGQVEESLQESKKALELDPHSPIIHLHLGWHFFYVGNHEQALKHFMDSLDLDPNFIVARLFLGQVYEQQGEYDQAIAEFQRGVEATQRNPVYVAALAHCLALTGQPEHEMEARALLEELHNRRRNGDYVPSYELAVVYAGLGEHTAALEWLESAETSRDSSWLVDVALDPRFKQLHSESRFRAMKTRLGLP